MNSGVGYNYPFVISRWRIYGSQTSRDDRYLVAFYRDERPGLKAIIKIWDMQTNREIATINNVRILLGFQFLPDGKSVLIGDTEKADSLLLIDLATGRPIRTFKGQRTIWEMTLSADGRLLAIGDADESILLWDTRVHY